MPIACIDFVRLHQAIESLNTTSSVQKRLSAILAADVAGYTRLMEQDSDGTVRAWQAARSDAINPLVTEFNGRLVKLTGDGFLAEFPTVLEAVTCAIRIQESLKSNQLDFRMGINLGDILDDGEDIHGEGVNVAARIEALAESGGINISGDVYHQIQHRLPNQFQDMGDVEVKNVSEPVRVYRLLQDGQTINTPTILSRKALVIICGAVFFTLLALAVVIWNVQPASETRAIDGKIVNLNNKPSIAVLPFNNMSEDASQEYFVDGMTEDLITDLSKVSGLLVIARNSTFAYKGLAINVSEVGRELGAKYVLEGSVRKAGNRIRINAQLIATEDGFHVWAERFDRDMTDIFALQDDVTRSIVSALAVKLTGGEQERRSLRRETNPEAYDALLRGLELFRRYTPETNLAARVQFERAVALDPNYARAMADISFSYSNEVNLESSPKRITALQQALKYGKDALALDPTVPQVHFALSVAYVWLGKHDLALDSALKVLELDPNYADGYVQLAFTYLVSGDPNKALEALHTAKRLNPLNPFFYITNEARAYFELRQYDTAAKLFEEALERNPNFTFARIYLAATYAHMGRLDDAKWEVQEVLTVSTSFSIANETQRMPYQNPTDLAHYIDGLRKAGLPE